MDRPEPRTLALLAVRRALGISVALFFFYVAAHYAWGQAFPTPADLLAILAVVSMGVALGVAFSHVWPLPAEMGVARVLRTVLLTVPALGIGVFLQVVLAGPQSERAYYLMFALGAWLGSTFVREDPEDTEDASSGSLFGGWRRLRDEGDDAEAGEP